MKSENKINLGIETNIRTYFNLYFPILYDHKSVFKPLDDGDSSAPL